MKNYIILFFVAISSISLAQSFVVEMKKSLDVPDLVGLESYFLWKKQHQKNYLTSKEEAKRFLIFQENKIKIDLHNSKNLGWKMALNKYSDLTFEEFKSQYLMESQHCSATKVGNHILSEKTLPNYVNWKDLGRVSPVKDQSKCGSCWTFSTTGCLESATAIHKKGHPLYTLSEQQLVDCAGNYNNSGCNGGLPSQAFEYIHYNKGLMDEWDYKYTAKDGTCKYDSSLAVGFVEKIVNITAGNEVELADAVAYQNPVSVAFDVTDDFMHYKSGIYSNPSCGDKPSQVNHAVLAVGYGTENGTDYWLVKNSWGVFWGSDGYFKIKRGSNMCGISDCASYPVVTK